MYLTLQYYFIYSRRYLRHKKEMESVLLTISTSREHVPRTTMPKTLYTGGWDAIAPPESEYLQASYISSTRP